MTAEDDRERPADGSGVATDAFWLVRHKVGLPDSTEGYVPRPDVEQRCALLGRRLTVLYAPGGFGKTALLVHRCRALSEQGVAVAWLGLDEEDGAGELATHLLLSFEQAGIATFGPAGRPGWVAEPAATDAEADSRAEYRVELLIRALANYRAACVLALDDAERLRSPGAVAVLNTLLRRAPRNLHVGMAFREPPQGLDFAMLALDGRGATVTADELRFARQDIARFFDGKLSRRELAAVAAESAGWPIALRIHRNARRRGTHADDGADGTAAAWVETRLWRGVPARDREFLLDIALFDRLEPELVSAVTGVANVGRRIASIGALAGLLSSTGGSGSGMRLHALVKEHCERRRFEEDAERYRAIHRRIAVALARRGRAVEALRHAAEANDAALLGGTAEAAGGVRLWLEQGLEALRAVDGLLTDEVLAMHPRLALVRCVVLASAGDMDGARGIYEAAERRTGGFAHDRRGGDDRALGIDRIMVQGLLHMCGCEAYGDRTMATVASAEAIAEAAGTAQMLRGMFSMGMCIVHNQMTHFEAAIEWAGRARSTLGRASPYLAHVDFQTGSVALARGRPAEARECYERALNVARASHLRDAGAVMIGDVLMRELEFERSAGTPRLHGPRVSPRLLGECTAWLDIYAASIAVAVETALLRTGPLDALGVVEDARDYALRTGRPALARLLAAMRVRALLGRGRCGRGGAHMALRPVARAAGCVRRLGRPELARDGGYRVLAVAAIGRAGRTRDRPRASRGAAGGRRGAPPCADADAWPSAQYGVRAPVRPSRSCAGTHAGVPAAVHGSGLRAPARQRTARWPSHCSGTPAPRQRGGSRRRWPTMRRPGTSLDTGRSAAARWTCSSCCWRTRTRRSPAGCI